MSRKAVADLAKKSRIPLRVLRNGKTTYAGTMDYRINRLNLELENNRVATARCG